MLQLQNITDMMGVFDGKQKASKMGQMNDSTYRLPPSSSLPTDHKYAVMRWAITPSPERWSCG